MRRAVTVGIAVVVSVVTFGGSAAGVDLPDAPMRLSGPTPYSTGCDGVPPAGTLNPGAEVQPQAAVNPTDARHIVSVWQQDRWSGVGAHGLVTATTLDGGLSWTRATAPMSSCGGGDFWRATDSEIALSPDGTAYLLSLSMNTSTPAGEHGILVSRSTTGGTSWQPPTTLTHESATGVWNDLPSVTADPADSATVYAVWDRVVETPLSGPIMLSRTTDHGATWEAPRTIHDPGPNRVAQAVRMVVLPDGALVALFTRYEHDPATNTASSTFQVIRSTDRGATWSAPVTIAEQQVVGTTDPVSGTPVRDGTFAGRIAVGPNGALYVVWQDSRFAGGARDGIALASSADGGMSWSAPRQVNADPAAQSFSPGIAVSPDGTVGGSYSAVHGDAAGNWISQSLDGGLTWTASALSDPFALSTAPKVDAGQLYLGDYHGMVASGSRFVTVFPQTVANEPGNPTDIFAAITPVRR